MFAYYLEKWGDCMYTDSQRAERIGNRVLAHMTVSKGCAVLLLALFLVSPCLAAEEITAQSYLLIERDTLTVLAGKDYYRELPPASTTKVMTTIVALERLSPDTIVSPTSKVTAIPPSKLNLVPGRQYRAADLVKGTMVQSANDAAYALAVAIGGSEENFATIMNARAYELGARNTRFINASGLYVPGQHTSCFDLALMFRHALDNPTFREIVATKYFQFKGATQDVRYTNHNRLLFCFGPSIGGKTGFTRASRHCYVGAFEKDGRVYILSMLGSKNLWADAVNILKHVYEDLPSKQDIRAAKACPVVLSSFSATSPEKLAAPKKKAKKVKARKFKPRKSI